MKLRKFTKKECSIIEKYFKTDKMYITSFGEVDCSLECQTCHFNHDCIVGGTSKFADNIMKQIKEIMPEEFI